MLTRFYNDEVQIELYSFTFILQVLLARSRWGHHISCHFIHKPRSLLENRQLLTVAVCLDLSAEESAWVKPDHTKLIQRNQLHSKCAAKRKRKTICLIIKCNMVHLLSHVIAYWTPTIEKWRILCILFTLWQIAWWNVSRVSCKLDYYLWGSNQLCRTSSDLVGADNQLFVFARVQDHLISRLPARK